MTRKLKYQGGLTKLICQKKAAWHKGRFRKNMHRLNNVQERRVSQVNFEIISFSGAAGFEDQLLSIWSFVYYAGEPIKWTIYSDKSYSEEQKNIFKEKFPFVCVIDWDTYDHCNNNKYLNSYLSVCGLAKKLNIIIGHPYCRQTIYLDSDIVFYKNISFYLNSGLLDHGLWFASDTLGEIKNYFGTKKTSMYPLNSGLLILNDTFNAEDIFEYFEDLNGAYGYFSEQSSFEYVFRKQGAQLLDPRQFINDPSDQFDFSMKYDPGHIAMRHYTNPVRHKMWQRGWNWHFRA